MLNVDTQTKNLFVQNDSVWKDIEIRVRQVDFGHETGSEWDEYSFDNDDIVSESLEIEQNLCDGEADFVGCVASKCTFSVYQPRSNDPLESSFFWLTPNYNYRVQVEVKPADGSRMLIWTGFVTDMEANLMNGEIKYICYDVFGTEEFKSYKFGDDLYSKLNNDGDMTVVQVLNFLSNSFRGLSFINASDLANDFPVKKQECFKGMEALELLKYICQMNGRFGIVRYDGAIEFRKILDPNVIDLEQGTYPSDVTYPDDETYPGFWNSGTGTVGRITLPYSSMETNDRLRFEEPPIDGVLIMETESTDVDKEPDNRKDVGTNQYGNHVIKIVGNPFIHDKTSDQKRSVCSTVLNNAGGFSYPNFTATTKGMPFVEVGDFVDFLVTDWNELRPQDKYKIHTCLITKRVLKGIQHMTDQYSAQTMDRYDDLRQATKYLCALSGASSVEQDIKDTELEEKLEEKPDREEVEEMIDDKIEECSNLWDVETVYSTPLNPKPRTIYLIRGIVTMHGYSETTGDD